MASLKYRMTEKIFQHTVKSIMSGTKLEFMDFVFSMTSKRKLEVPSQRWQARYEYREVERGEQTIIQIGPKGKEADKLLFYMTGDGLYEPPAVSDIEMCGDIADSTGRMVWLVSYPLLPMNTPASILKSTADAYKEAVEKYGADNITLMGLSCGGNLCLALCHYLREHDPDVPLPSGIILQSAPLRLPPTAGQIEEMRKIEPHDCVQSDIYFMYVADIVSFKGFEYLMRPMDHDMQGFPPISIFYGSYEMAYAYLEEFKEKCAREGVSLDVHVGEGMMHNWCLLGNTPEAQQVRKEYYRILQ